MTMASVRVAVRVRPLNQRERELNSKLIINMKGHTTCILDSKNSPSGHLGEGKSFTYDYSYDSTDSRSHSFVSQEKVFEDLGCDVLKDAFEGYNACVFAYGQTGSGKSYTMMGHKGDVGLIPRICEGLFGQISEKSQSNVVSFHTEVSYLEIHNERVQDLLQKRSTESGGLRVREHPKDGPYVEDLSKHVVNDYSDVEELMNMGNTNRTIASTGMNAVSSRSHAIFTISFTQARFDTDMPCETLSKLHLVDLAGSERANSARSTGARLKEGANINRSLVTLGSVISALADLSESTQLANTTKRKKQVFVPYRDSVLTWLLKDSLGGNSKTIMIAAISPAHVNYGETLSTLRYACRAKNIVNTPTVNEDSSVKVIKELQEEIARLRGLVDQINQVYHGDLSTSQKVEAKLHESEAKVHALTKEWANKWGETQTILKEETLALRKEGSGVVLDCQLPHLIGIDEDLLSTGIILYHLKEGSTLVGREEASSPQDIVLHGPGLQNEHCVLENQAGSVTLIPLNGALCSVNGAEVSQPWQLTQGALIRLGRGTMFRFNHPTEAAQLREKRKTGLLSLFNPSMPDPSASAEILAKAMILNPGIELEKRQQEQLLKLEDQRRHMKEAKEVQEKEEAELERRRQEVEVQHKEWQEVQETLHRRNQEVERRLWKLLQHRKAFGGGEEPERGDAADGPTYSLGDGLALVDAPAESVCAGADQNGPEQLETLQAEHLQDTARMAVQMDGNESEPRLSSSVVLPPVPEPCTPCMNEAMPGSSLVSLCEPDVDRVAPLQEACSREDREQESHASHKSGPGLTSTGLEEGAARGASGADVGLHGGGEERPGDASLPQTAVPDAGDGCGTGPEGEANESHCAADGGGGGRGGPSGSSGSSLGSVSHLQGTGGGGSSTPILPQAAARSPPCTPTQSNPPALRLPEEATLEGRLGRGLMDGSGSPEEDRRESQVDTQPGVEQSSGVGSMVSKVSWMFQDAGRLLRSSPKVLQRVRKEGLQPVGACWSSQVVSLVRKSQVMAVVKDSQMFSLVMESQAISLVRDSQLLSMVKEMTQSFPSAETAGTLPSLTTQDLALALFSDQTSTVKPMEMLQDQSLSKEADLSAGQRTIGRLDSPPEQESVVKDLRLEQSASKEQFTSKEQLSPEEHEAQGLPRLQEQPCQSLFPEPAKSSVTTQDWEGVQVFCQNLLDFPEALLKLQALSPVGLIPSLLPAIPLAVLSSQRVLALYWLSAAKASQPLPRPALLVLMESALYTLTSDLGALELFHYLPLLQLTEVQVGFAGQSLDLTCAAEEGVLCLHTHSQALTQGLCRALLRTLSPGHDEVSQHPLLQGNLMALSLDWEACVPDLLLDSGLRLRCHFQKTLADLAYLLHGNMDQERASLGEVRLLLYTTVVVSVSSNPRAAPRAQLLLTDTHLGLVQEDAVFHPAPCTEAPEPRRSLFQDMTLRRCSDIRCVLVRDGDADWSTKLDVIIARAGGRGHPERAAGGAVPSAQDSNSSPQPEVWKLTFGCSAEAACLINHLSNV